VADFSTAVLTLDTNGPNQGIKAYQGNWFGLRGGD
jgi:hypothetical protein